jgi:hypothetical protein
VSSARSTSLSHDAAPARPRAAAAARELAQWQCAMEELHELEYQFARARKAGNRDLMLRLRGEVQAVTLRTDLLLARAVADSRHPTPSNARAAGQHA